MKSFFKNFYINHGIWIGLALFISKIANFVITWVAIRWLTKDDFGAISSAINVLGFFLALNGLGAYQGVLRFGALAKETERDVLFGYSFRWAVVFQLFANLLYLMFALCFFHNSIGVFGLCALFSIRFFGLFLLETAKAEARARFDNRKYALLDIAVSIALLILGLPLLYFFAEKGYLFALCISPFVVLLLHRFNLKKHKFPSLSYSKKDFWSFSFQSAGASQVGELVFLLDVFFIGIFLNTVAVAEFRVSNIIPNNLLFVSYIFLQTNYPELCKRYQDKAFQRNYLINYYKTLVPICSLLLILGLFFSHQIMEMFGAKYQDTSVFSILLFSSISVMLLRAPFTYVLSALGKPKWNLMVSCFMILFFVLNYYIIIPKNGIVGVAYTNLVGLTLSGILYALAYFYELKKL